MRQLDEPIRAWKLAYVDHFSRERFVLHGVGTNTTYKVVDQAICLVDGQHKFMKLGSIPARDCSCGFYAWKTRDLAVSQNREWGSMSSIGGRMLLEVDLYGKVIVHRYGFRAEKQRVLGVWSIDNAYVGVDLGDGIVVQPWNR